MKLVEVIRLLESNGFVLIRSNAHSIYACGLVRVAVPHGRVVSAGIMREVFKAIKASNLSTIDSKLSG